MLAVILSIAMPTFMSIGSEPLAMGASIDMKHLGVDDDWQIWGDEDTIGMGNSIASGDLDGDGRDDLAVGIPVTGEGTPGTVLVYFSRDPDDLYPAWGSHDADLIVYGATNNDHFGGSLAIADLSGDGRAELMIGAPYADGPNEGRRDCGEVYILDGRSRSAYGVTIQIASISTFGHLIGREGADHLGVGIDVGDLDGDGVLDIVVRSEGAGGYLDPGDAGRENLNHGSWEIEVIAGDLSGVGLVDLSQSSPLVRFFGSLSSGGPLTNEAATHIGNGMAIGDLNGDGQEDLAFSFRTPTTGAVCLYLGGVDFSGGNPDIVVPEDYDLLLDLGEDGYEQAPLELGDVDADGADDLLVGIPGSSGFDSWRRGAGQVDLYAGRDIGSSSYLTRDHANWTVFGEDSSDGMGSSILMIDNDGDGMDEVFVGTPYSDGEFNAYDGCGEGYGFEVNFSAGRYHNLSEADFSAMGDGVGWGSFSSMGSMDMDGDGTRDLLISSPGAVYEDEWTFGGLITLLMGKPIWDARFFGPQPLSKFGEVSLISDIDSDGYGDILISATKAGTASEGEVYLFFGDEEGFSGYYSAEDDPDLTFKSERDDQILGGSLAVGDLNGDNLPDILIGAPKYYTGPGEGGWGVTAGAVWFYWGDTKANMLADDPVNLAVGSNEFIRGERTIEAGTSICVGDFNGDGKDDLAIGAPMSSSGNMHHNGKVFIFYGPITFPGNFLWTNDADVEIHGALNGEELGTTLTKGDIDGDSIDDLVMGAPRSSPGSINGAGSVYIIKGNGSWSPDIYLASDKKTRIDGEWPYDAMGFSLLCDDIDHDGRSDLIMGAPRSDGDRRSLSEAGAVYMLYGKYLAPDLADQTLRIREGTNMTIYGSTRSEQLGFSLASGDIDGDGLEDIAMGAKDSTNPNNGLMTGRVFILLTMSEIEHLKMLSSSLPYLATQDHGDYTGYSLSCGDLDLDGKADLLIGATGHDPEGSDSPVGTAFLWLSKQMFYSEYKAGDAIILNGHHVSGETRGLTYVCPGEGPYVFRVNARCLVGFDAVRNLTLTIKMEDGSGEASFTYNTQTTSFSSIVNGVMMGLIELDEGSSRAWHEGLDMYYADFALKMNWGVVGPDQVLTRVDTAIGSHVNYRSETFCVDDGIGDVEGSMTLDNSEGWISSDHLFSVEGMSLKHTVTGMKFSVENLQNVSLGLNRPDGIRIKNSSIEGGTHVFHNVSVGTHISGKGLRFTIDPISLPPGGVWDGNVSFTLDVDTSDPSFISSFKVYPDGRMENSGNLDDDVQVEVWWDDQVDFGHSGIATTMLRIAYTNGTLYDILQDVEPGDILILPEGGLELYLWSVDNAGNEGPPSSWDMMIDLTRPTFQNFTPDDGEWVNDKYAEFSVVVGDSVSDIDGSSAMYRTYRSDSSELTAWKYVFGVLNVFNGKQLIVQPSMPEGRGHYIQWSVSDNVGRESTSEVSYFNVDLTPPSIDIVGGAGVRYVMRETITLSSEIQDPLSGILFDTIEYRFGHAHGFYDLPWESVGLTGQGAAAYPSVDVTPTFAGYGYLQWRAVDVAGNAAESELGTVYVDENLPIFSTFEPNSSMPQRDRKVTVSVSVIEDESGIDKDGMEMAVSTVSGWISYGVGAYSPWIKMSSIEEVDVGLFRAEATLTLDEGPFNLIKFRVRDRAGNGWVVSTPQRVEVELFEENLPPEAVMQLIPGADFILQGEFITLDGSASSDPEGLNLTYEWYSDMEGYPGEKLLGTSARIEVELTRIGVHHLWLEVSDGTFRVMSEPVLLQVMEAQEEEGGQPSGDEKGLGDYLVELIPIMILLVIIGILIGVLIGAFISRSRKDEGPVLVGPGEEGFPEVQTELAKPLCPHCDEEVRVTDDYCMTCGAVFTNADVKKIKRSANRKRGSGKKGRKKRPSVEEVPMEDSVTELPRDDQVLEMEEPPEQDEALEMEEPPDEEELVEFEEEIPEMDEVMENQFPEMEDLEGWDEDDLEWEGDQ